MVRVLQNKCNLTIIFKTINTYFVYLSNLSSKMTCNDTIAIIMKNIVEFYEIKKIKSIINNYANII